MKPAIYLFNSLFLLFLNDAPLQGAKPVILTDSLKEFCIVREYIEYLEDPSGKLTIQNILKIPDQKFHSTAARDLTNENKSSAYWLRFQIQNKSQSANYRIELFDFDIDEISFYYADTSGFYKEQKAGFSFPFSFRQINHKNVSFQLPADYCISCPIYMRFKSKKTNVLEPMVRSYDTVLNYALNEYLLFGIFYGLLLLLIFYNFLYFISLRKNYYLYYVLYGCGALLYLMSRNGTGFQYLWFNYPFINNYAGESGLFIATLGMILFTRSFLELKSKAAINSRLTDLAFVIRIIIYSFQVIFPHYFLFEIIDLFYIQIMFYIAFRQFRSGNYSSQWLLIAFTVLNISLLVSLLEQTNILPSTIFTVYSVNIGITFEFIFLSIGIAETVKQTYKDHNKTQRKLILQYKQNEMLKEKVNRELEEKVKERTEELGRANEELKRKAEENMKMSQALDIANNELKKYLHAFAKTSVMKTHLNFDDFKKAYPDEISCIRYICELKEKAGFICIKCGNTRSIKGKAKFDVRCSKCNYNESITANTIFHRTKFPLQKAFYMLYMVFQKKDRITAAQLSKTLELQNTTCQNFKNKVLERMDHLRKTYKQKEISWDNIILDQEKFVENERAFNPYLQSVSSLINKELKE